MESGGFPILDCEGLDKMWVSIAHSKNYGASLLSEVSTHPIGVDIEEIKTSNNESLSYFLSSYQKKIHFRGETYLLGVNRSCFQSAKNWFYHF